MQQPTYLCETKVIERQIISKVSWVGFKIRIKIDFLREFAKDRFNYNGKSSSPWIFQRKKFCFYTVIIKGVYLFFQYEFKAKGVKKRKVTVDVSTDGVRVTTITANGKNKVRFFNKII